MHTLTEYNTFPFISELKFTIEFTIEHSHVVLLGLVEEAVAPLSLQIQQLDVV